MRKFKDFKHFLAFILLTIIGLSCKKSQPGYSDSGQLQIIKNSTLANSRNALQAVYSSSDQSSKGYYYGTFNSNGVPDSIFQIVINKSNGDTSVNIFLDNQQRIKSIYLTYAGIKSNSLLTFDYTTLGKTLVSVFQYNFNNDNSKLLYQYTVDNTIPNYPLISKTNYASFGSGILQMLLQINTGGVTVPDRFGSQLITIQGKIAVLNLVILTGSTAIGCLIGGGFPGCVLGGIVGNYLVYQPASANASEINSSPANSPQSPYNQTQNTQLQKTNYFVGTVQSYQFNYGGSGFCNLIGEYYNISVDIKIDKSANSIISSQAVATQKETKVDPTCSPNSSVIPINQHKYQFSSGQISGTTISLNYSTIDANPYSNAHFTGTISEGLINGTFKIIRSDGVPGTLNYSLNIPMVAKLIN